MKLQILTIILAALLLAGCGRDVTQDVPAPAPTEAPEPSPAAPEAAEEDPDVFRFSTTDRDGNAWDESVFTSNVLTMINFWEPWCGPCVGEMGDLQKLQDAYASRGFQILGVYQTPGMEEDVDAVLRSTGVTYPILHYTGEFDVFQSGYVPTTVFVDGDGHVIGEGSSALYIGSNSYEGWAAIVEGML